MKIRFPEQLQPNDIIGICAPSSGVREHLFDRLNNSLKNINKLGYRTIETDSVRKSVKCVSACAKQRAEEFMSLYQNPEVKVILPPWGGEFLMDMLPYLNFDLIAKLPPKWVVGYSDITTLTFPLTLLCDIATIHGSNLMNMGFKTIHETDLVVFEAMKNDAFVQVNPLHYGCFISFDDISAEAYHLDIENRYKILYKEDKVRFSGRMIGGCMDVICKLIGTRFAPVNNFIEENKKEGLIWTLESCEMTAADIYRTLWQMRECGWFRHCSGILIGRPAGYSDTGDFTLRDALSQSFDGLNIPVIYDADIGHVPPQIQIINGSLGLVEYCDGKIKLTQEKR